MNEMQPQRHTSVSPLRVLTIVVPLALIAVGAYVWSRTLEPKARDELASKSFTKILASNAELAGSAMKYPDKDNDLVADSPDDPAKCIKPNVLVFSFVASGTD